MKFEIKNATVLEVKDNSEGKYPSDTTTLELLENGRNSKSVFRFKLDGALDLLSGDVVSISGEATGFVSNGKNSIRVTGEKIKLLSENHETEGGEN